MGGGAALDLVSGVDLSAGSDSLMGGSSRARSLSGTSLSSFLFGPPISLWATALLPSRALQARTTPNRHSMPPSAIHPYLVFRFIRAPLLRGAPGRASGASSFRSAGRPARHHPGSSLVNRS